MAAVKLGIIGCGKVVRLLHLPALRRVKGARVTAVADPVEKARLEAARLAGRATVFADWRELLDRGDCDAVMICTPTVHHAECATQALAAGKHVYVEKPLASTLLQAQAVVQTWESAGLLGMIGFNYRHHPLFSRLHEVVNSGQLGKVIGARSLFTSSGDWVDEWRTKRSQGGGVLLDLAAHHIDLVHYVLGQPVAGVSAHVASERSEQDTAGVQMTLAEGAIVQCFVSLYGTDANRFEVFGESARATVDYLAGTLEIVPRGRRRLMARIVAKLAREGTRLTHALKSGYDPSYEVALSRFVNGVANQFPNPKPDLMDGLRVLQVIDAAEKSAATGRTCSVEVIGTSAPVAR